MRPTGMTVATFNLYLGADLGQLFVLERDEDFAPRTAALWSAVEASRPAERMTAAARLLARYLPDVIAVQEAGLWTAGAMEAERRHDLLDLLLRALSVQGTPYRLAVEGGGFTSAELTDKLSGLTHQRVELRDRGAILVRDDPGVRVQQVTVGSFDTALPAQVLGREVGVHRGWCTADLTVGEAELRVIGVHLESWSAQARIAQARELADVVLPAGRRVPTVVLGDINCPPGVGDAYEVITGTGLRDAWDAVHPDESGFTCGQAPDLRNRESSLNERIDMVFVDPALQVCQATVIGDHREDRTASGLWPSDHACLVVGLEG